MSGGALHEQSRRDAQGAAAHDQGLSSTTWRALGTSVQVVATDNLEVVRGEVERVLDAIDAAASRFRADSELRRLTPGQWTAASPLFARAVAVARAAAEWTGGAVDPTLGLALGDLGYDRTFTQVEVDGATVRVVRRGGGWRDIAVEGNRVKAPSGLDLGATAKGLAADLAAQRAGRFCDAVLVSLGGDMATSGGRAWPVLVTDSSDLDSVDHSGQVIELRGALATSSTTARRWNRGGQLMHHLLDPATCRPTRGPWRTASVLAQTCLAANTASTAAIVLGPRAPDWLRERGLDARLVHENGTVVRVGRWPDSGPQT